MTKINKKGSRKSKYIDLKTGALYEGIYDKDGLLIHTKKVRPFRKFLLSITIALFLLSIILLLGNNYYEKISGGDKLEIMTLSYISAAKQNNEGWALYEEGKYDKALEAFNKTIELNDELSAYGYYGKGRTLYELEKYDDALKALNRSIELDPNLGYPYYWKGAILFNQGKEEEALTALEIYREWRDTDGEDSIQK